ncbi:MAG: sulfatase-like hydrolase/transferase [Christensenellales bacterium]
MTGEDVIPQRRKSNFDDKLNALLADKRKYGQRLILSLFVTFGACFTFLFFGPVELTHFNSKSLVFTAKAVAPIMAVFAFVVCIAISAAVSMIKGRVYNYVISAAFSILISGYIQGNLLNDQRGVMDGTPIVWQSGVVVESMLFDQVVWLVIFLLVYALLYFNRRIWRRTLIYVSLALVIMQSTALAGIFLSEASADSQQREGMYFTTAEMYTYSKAKNTLVFVLDRLDYDFVEEVLNDDSGFFNALDGFTCYTNAISKYARTNPAINYMFTGYDDMYIEPPENSWNGESNILEELKLSNCRVDLYTEIKSMFGKGSLFEECVSNLSIFDEFNISSVIGNLALLSAYRYAPPVVKPFAWTYTDMVNSNIYITDDHYETYEIKYAEGIDTFALDNTSNYFKLYHFVGSHNPYFMNADGTMNSNYTTSLEQTKGNFQILFNAFKKMKELGIYNQASIIITADHGSAVDDYLPLQKATRIGLFYKPSGSADTPLTFSSAQVSHKNMPATIAKSVGIDYEKYGRPFDEISEGEDIARTYCKSVMEGNRESELYVYEVEGDASDFSNWKVEKIEDIMYPFN